MDSQICVLCCRFSQLQTKGRPKVKVNFQLSFSVSNYDPMMISGVNRDTSLKFSLHTKSEVL